MRSGHAGIGDRSRSSWKDPRVVRLHVGVSPEDGRNSPVENARDRNLLACRLCVEVDEHDVGLPPRVLDEGVEELEGRHRAVEEQPAEQVDDRDRRAVPRRGDGEPFSGKAGAEVRGPDHAVGGGEVREDLVAGPRVVPQGNDVGSGSEQAVGELRRDTATVRCVLSVHDAELDRELVAKPRQPTLDRSGSGRAEHIGDEEDPQRGSPAATEREASARGRPRS